MHRKRIRSIVVIPSLNEEKTIYDASIFLMDNKINTECECEVSTDSLHCNKCNHIFCGSCEIVIRHINYSDLTTSPKKACPKCFSTDLYRKMSVKQKNDFGLS